MASKGSSIVGSIGNGISTVLGMAMGPIGMIGSALFNVASTFGGMFMDFLGKGVDMLMGLPKMLGVGFLAAAGSVIGGLYGAHKLLGPAADSEMYGKQLKHQGKADMLPFLEDLAGISNSSTGEMVKAGIYSNNLGLDTKTLLPILNDVTAMVEDMRIDDLIRAMGMLKAGRYGEGLESLSRVGVTREVLSGKGIKFDGQGSVAKESEAQMMSVVTNLLKTMYAGAAQEMAGTYKQLISNLGDDISRSLKNAFAGALPYAEQSVSVISGMFKSMGEQLSIVDWAGIGSSFVNLATVAADTIKGVDWLGMFDAVNAAAAKCADIAAYLFTAEGWASLGDAFAKSFDNIIVRMEGVFDASATLLWEALKTGGDWVYSKLLDLPGGIIKAMSGRIKGITEGMSASDVPMLLSNVAMGVVTPGFLLGKMTAGALENLSASQGVSNLDDARANFRSKITDLGKSSYEPFAGFANKAPSPEAREAKEQNNKLKEAVDAIRQGNEALEQNNKLASQLLHEMRVFNEYSQSDISGAMFA
jgi:hypothetical protein